MTIQNVVRYANLSNVQPKCIDGNGNTDQLVVQPPNYQATAAPGIAAAATVAYATPNLVGRQGAGKVLVLVEFVALASVAATVTATMQRDGVNIGGVPTSVYSVAAGDLEVNISMSWIDTLPDDNAHNYGVTVTTSAGTLTVTAGQGSVTALEL